MPLFNPSTIAYSAACQQIADAAGASANPVMTTRAHVSLNAAIKHFNNKANWDFLRVEADPITIPGPFSVTGISASANQTSAAVPAGHGFEVDDLVVGSLAFRTGTRVSATGTTSIGLNYTINSTIGTGVQGFSATALRDMFAVPTGWKSEYAAKLLISQRGLWSITMRQFQRSSTDPNVLSTPSRYDQFSVGAKGKLRLHYPPAAFDVLQLWYYRRIDTPTASAATAVLDIADDYDPYLIAWAKWHFLVDKTEGRGEQAATWIALANEGLKTMLADQTRRPDEDLMLQPGQYDYSVDNPNSTRQVPWDY